MVVGHVVPRKASLHQGQREDVDAGKEVLNTNANGHDLESERIPHYPLRQRLSTDFQATMTRMTHTSLGSFAATQAWRAILGTALFLGVPSPVLAETASAATPAIAPTDKPSSDAAKAAKSKPAVDIDALDSLLSMADKDPGRLAEVPVTSVSGAAAASTSAPSDTLNSSSTDFSNSTSTGDLLKQLPNVSGRRLSGVNVDPRVRGYNSAQLNASANGMTQRQSIQDIDSLFSQIDPGIIQDITVLDGPYTSLYGPGFAFITADLNAPKRYDLPQMHLDTTFNYESNGQILYNRENVWGGGKDWGAVVSYGVRSGNDYTSGGDGCQVPSSFKKWDAMLSLSYSLNAYSRLEFDMLHTEYNNVEMPGIVYDLQSSTNNQYNLRYIIQEDPDGPKQLLVQTWRQETLFYGNASSESKQETFYQRFIADTAENEGYLRPATTLSNGYQLSTGLRCLRTLGQADGPQWTFGADWREYEQRYLEQEVDANGINAYDGALYGVPTSKMDDVGVLTHVILPANDSLSFTAGGRVDYAKTWLGLDDPIVSNPPWTTNFEPGTNMPDYTLGMAYLTAKVKLNDHDTLSVGNGFAMRAPSTAELYSQEIFTPVVGFGNSITNGYSELKPEKNWQFDVGVVCDRAPFRYGARGFYATIWDYIQAIPSMVDGAAYSTHELNRNFEGFASDLRTDIGEQCENGDTCQAFYETRNLPLVTMTGADVFGEVELRPGVSVFGCMSYVHAVNVHPIHMDSLSNYVAVSNGGAEPLSGIYPFTGRVSLRICDPDKKRDKWGAEFVARFVHSQDEVATSYAELTSPGFSVFDLKGYYRLRENIRLTLALENLLNRDYYEPGSLVYLNSAGVVTHISEPGFTAMLGLDARF